MTYLPREILTQIDEGKDLFDELEELLMEDDDLEYDDMMEIEMECDYTVDY
jgi:hypothetical protein